MTLMIYDVESQKASGNVNELAGLKPNFITFFLLQIKSYIATVRKKIRRERSRHKNRN